MPIQNWTMTLSQFAIHFDGGLGDVFDIYLKFADTESVTGSSLNILVNTVNYNLELTAAFFKFLATATKAWVISSWLFVYSYRFLFFNKW